MSKENVLKALLSARTVNANNAEVITPEMAEAFLEGNTHNRLVKTVNFKKLVDDMAAGRWDFNGESIKFAEDGTLLDGQHRLLACVESGKPFIAIIVTGLPAVAQETIDTGSSRSLADVLRLRGYASANELSSFLRYRVKIDKFGIDKCFTGASNNIAIPNAVALGYLEKPGVMEDFNEMRNFPKRAFKVPQSTVYAVFPELKKASPEDFYFFVEKIFSGENLDASDPISMIRSVYIQQATVVGGRNAGYSDKTLAALTIKAWNKFMNGEKCECLRFRTGGAKPEHFPEIATA